VQGWTEGPRSSFTEAEVRAALELAYGPRVRHRVILLTNSDVETSTSVPVDMKKGGDVSWDYRVPDSVGGGGRSDASVRRTAKLTMVGDVSFNVMTNRFKLRTEILSPQNNWVPFDMGVFVSTLPPVNDDGVLVTRDLDLADKTFRYARPIPASITIAAGTVATSWVDADLLATFGETKRAISPSSVTLPTDLVFDPGTPRILVYNKLLEIAGYDHLIADEYGVPTARPLSTVVNKGVEHRYGPGGTILTAGRLEALIPDLPNVVRFVARGGPSLPVEGNGWRTKYNQSTGPGSITARGGEEVWRFVEVAAESQTALDAIADSEAQRYFAGGGLRYTGKVGLNPRHSDRDVNALVKPRLGLTSETDAWLVTDWRYPLREIESPDDVLMAVTWERRVVLT
jgi:hypothetical protein